ncbi:MAG: hypothetical protein Kow0042_11550 [Calditrichia bacterium]
MKLHQTIFILLTFLTLVWGEENEYYFRFRISDINQLDYLTHIISIDNVVGKTVYAYANEKEFERFKPLSYSYEILPHPGSLYPNQMSENLLQTRDWDTYPTYTGYLQMMQQFATNYPGICRLDTFGYSVNGRLLLALVISDNVHTEEMEPEFFYTSTMHGDETVGYVLLLRLADYLLTHYGETTTPEGRRVTRLVNNLEIWINPLFNPDGTYRGSNNTIINPRRYNANGVDLNRNFPDRINDPNNTPYGREPETQAMMALAVAQNFVMSANFHGGTQVVNYPWDNGAPSGSYSASPDDAWYIKISKTYATPNPDLMNGSFPNGITNGCQWYAIFGGRQDWMYYFEGGRETTIELYNTKNPPGSVLPQRWNNNKESFLAYMEEALRGIAGRVTDKNTGLPVEAQIDVIGIPGVPVYSDPDLGDFYRLLLPGTYSLRITAPRYFADTLHNVVVVDSPMTFVDVQLTPWPKGAVYGKVHLRDSTYHSDVLVSIEDQWTYTNPEGFFSFPAVYSGQIQIKFEKAGYLPTTLDALLSPEDTLWIETELYPTSRSVLLVDDDSGDRGIDIAIGGKTESVEIPSRIRGQSADLVQSTLEQSGYRVIRESSENTQIAEWDNYGLLIWSSGANFNPLANSLWRTELINYVNAGGKLLIEGGEIGYDHQYQTTFAQNVLHISGWVQNAAGNLVVTDPNHPLTTNLSDSIPLSYSNKGDQDAVLPIAGADLVLQNANYTTTGGAILGNNVLYLAFNLDAINVADAQQLIRNSVGHFLPTANPQVDIALYELIGLQNGNLVLADSVVLLRVVLKNYGQQTYPAGGLVSLTISNGSQTFQQQSSTVTPLAPGDTSHIYLGEWIVPDLFDEWTVTARIDTTGDELPPNNDLTLRIISLSTDVSFYDDFEGGEMGWTILSPDSSPPVLRWNTVSWPTAGGQYAKAVFPGTLAIHQNEWLISPQLINARYVNFYWDYGADQVGNNTLLLLASATNPQPSSFTDTLLVLNPGQQVPANGFSDTIQIALNSLPHPVSYIAFVYQGKNGKYWAIDNLIVRTAPSALREGTNPIPDEFSLLQNFPNPFNPRTTIEFTIPHQSTVVLEIFNTLGERVQTLISGHYAPGRYQAVLDGNSLSSGIYFYRLKARFQEGHINREFVKTRKLILVK